MKKSIFIAVFSLIATTAFSQVKAYDLFENDTVFMATLESAQISTGINKTTGDWLTDTTVTALGKIEISNTRIKITGPMTKTFKVIRVTSDPRGFLFLVHDESSNKFYNLDYIFSENWQGDRVLITITGNIEEFVSLNGRVN
jgi:hypothetical protein